ncbi:aldo/keto reductase family oxidoreductase [Thalassotalea aquiviva]|uniref:aldo/keto reductase n=1 Tax=Thalassotalea aquiviva TaxID=3242415 RepID=UPI00352B9A0D
MSQFPLPLNKHLTQNSPLVYGCMGLGGQWNDSPVSKDDLSQAHQVIDAALEADIRLFDHADIYTFGKAEQVFGQVLKERPELREQISIQSKCGIRFPEGNLPGRYDSSGDWISQSVDNILSRLQIETLDVLMIHRPDPLMQAEEVADTFNRIKQSGKVKHFGVSNMNAAHMQHLQNALPMPLVVNQIEMSLTHLNFLEEKVSTGSPAPIGNFQAGTIEYCQHHGVQLQAWGSLSQGKLSGGDLSTQPEHIRHTAKLVEQLAGHYQVSKEAIILAWLMRHPASIQPIIGSTNIERIKACKQANNLVLTREHWYQLYVSARGERLP